MRGIPENCQAIVLSRINYSESDRILTLLTLEKGKLSVLAKGVRKEKSKLAGGVELFSESEVSLAAGNGDLYILTSARLLQHFALLLKDFARSQTAYQLLKLTSQASHEGTGAELYLILRIALKALGDAAISAELVKLWFEVRLLEALGHDIDIKTDISGKILKQEGSYKFDFDKMAFCENDNGEFKASHIKLLRLLLSYSPEAVSNVKSISKLLPQLEFIVTLGLTQHIGVTK